jgi:hypothetical protein
MVWRSSKIGVPVVSRPPLTGSRIGT